MATSNILTLKGKTESEFVLVSDDQDKKRGRRIVYKKIFIGGDPENINITGIPDPKVAAGLTSISMSSDDGVHTVQWVFECEPSTMDEYLELDGSFAVVPIGRHPQIFEFVADYARGLKDGEPDWYFRDPKGGEDSGGGLSGGGGTGGSSKINPFYGVTGFISATASYSYTQWYRNRASVPASFVNSVASIQSPDGLDGANNGEWLYCGCRIYNVGSGYRVTRTWMSSERGTKWITELY